MKVFLCYASEDHATAGQVQLAVAAAGHEVFFDQQSLPAGSDFHARIREAVNQSDLFVFLITASSIAKGKFSLTELQFAREKWPRPAGHVIPVNVGELPISALPNYLRAVTVLNIQGDAPSEIRAAIESIEARRVGSRDRAPSAIAHERLPGPIYFLARTVPDHSRSGPVAWRLVRLPCRRAHVRSVVLRSQGQRRGVP